MSFLGFALHGVRMGAALGLVWGVASWGFYKILEEISEEAAKNDLDARVEATQKQAEKMLGTLERPFTAEEWEKKKEADSKERELTRSVTAKTAIIKGEDGQHYLISRDGWTCRGCDGFYDNVKTPVGHFEGASYCGNCWERTFNDDGTVKVNYVLNESKDHLTDEETTCTKMEAID